MSIEKLKKKLDEGKKSKYDRVVAENKWKLLELSQRITAAEKGAKNNQILLNEKRPKWEAGRSAVMQQCCKKHVNCNEQNKK